MTEQAKVPAIRFAGFTDPWEQRKLGDVTDSFSGGTPDGSHASYYGGSIPFIRSAEINSDKTELFLTEKGLDNSSAKIVERGTVLYALYGATSGEVGIAAIKGAINQAILALSPHTGNDPLFLASWLRREKARIVDTYLQGGQGNLSGSIIKELSFALPQQKEQQVIGSFFSHLDNLITLHQRKYDKLVVFKKSMLEKMFPKDGESVPEIRFAGFTDPWEQRKLVELYEKNDERNTFGLGAERTLSIATMTFNSEGNGADASSLPNYKVIRVGDVAFEGHSNKSFAYGRFVVNAVADGIMSPRFSCLRPKNSYPVRFWKYYIHSEQVMRDILVRATKSGTMMNELVIDDLFKQSIAVPQEAEQQAIGYFFSHLDTLITLHQRKLELLRNIKKSLLDRMFV